MLQFFLFEFHNKKTNDKNSTAMRVMIHVYERPDQSCSLRAESARRRRPSSSYPSLRSGSIAESVKGATKNCKLYFVRLALVLL